MVLCKHHVLKLRNMMVSLDKVYTKETEYLKRYRRRKQMKKLMKKVSILFFCMFLITGLNLVYAPAISAYTEEDTIELLLNEPNTVQTSLTEKQFVESLEKQGFTVEKKEATVREVGLQRATNYIIRKPLTQNAAPKGEGKVPGNHYIDATYKTTNGWNYFVTFKTAGIELKSSNYNKENDHSTWEQRYGGQGVYWRTTVQYTYTSSKSISISAGWIGASVGGSYIYRTSLVEEESTFNFPIMQ